jgi:hypothetical protein
MQLFSNIVMRDILPPLKALIPFHSTCDNTQAVIATPKAQPSLSVVYKFEIDNTMPSKPPVITARSVNCRA